MTGFHRPTAGDVRFDGRSIAGLRPHQVCRLGMARTFQIVQPFPGLTVLDNAAVGAFTRHREVAAARAAARETLELSGPRGPGRAAGGDAHAVGPAPCSSSRGRSRPGRGSSCWTR